MRDLIIADALFSFIEENWGAFIVSYEDMSGERLDENEFSEFERKIIESI